MNYFISLYVYTTDFLVFCLPSAAMKLMLWMISADIPHNVFITRGQALDDSRGPDVEVVFEVGGSGP
jgi:hypothetical protein